MVDALELALGHRPGFCTIVLPTEAVIPPLYESIATIRPLNPEKRPPSRIEAFFSRDRLSTEELYDDIEESIRLRASFLLTVLVSALIAGLGMRSGQTAIVIGAMVIAPFLGPSIGMAMAATIGDHGLGRRASLALVIGAVTCVAFMTLVGGIIKIDPTVPELLSRTRVSPADVVLALASGSAGVIAFSRGSASSLIGVMIAVALVPPLAAAGLLYGSGNGHLSLGALILFATNLVCINVAGILTFLFQGLAPRSWRMTAGTLLVWLALLAVLIALILPRFLP
ncbi:TIGR00341 family protein [uncultured Brevundimonas sp.]|uniref:TIGR00341 family protein n=1 Tax=uncultured Brevundimonas sp. TaxID=213418 RepID=UPI0030EBEA05